MFDIPEGNARLISVLGIIISLLFSGVFLSAAFYMFDSGSARTVIVFATFFTYIIFSVVSFVLLWNLKKLGMIMVGVWTVLLLIFLVRSFFITIFDLISGGIPLDSYVGLWVALFTIPFVVFAFCIMVLKFLWKNRTMFS
jgi:hypothetical protein